MKAFVTGSTGLLGSNLVNTLVAAGYEVKALARSREKAEKLLPRSHVEIVVGDIEDVPGFASQLAGVDVLFHTAAYVRESFSPGNHWPKLEKINVQATRDLLIHADKQGVKLAIHTSSTGVLGTTPHGAPSDESTLPDKYSLEEPYPRSKVLAEQVIAEFRKDHRLPIISILPSAIFGPQDSGPSATGQGVIQILERKFPVIPPGGMSMIDARDVAAAMISAAERGRNGERYVVSRGYITLDQLAQTLGKQFGVPVPTRHVPYAALILMAHAGEFASRITGSQPMISVSAVRAMNRRHEVSSAKAIRELGVTFRPFEDTIRDTANWLLANGYVQSGPQTQPASA